MNVYYHHIHFLQAVANYLAGQAPGSFALMRGNHGFAGRAPYGSIRQFHAIGSVMDAVLATPTLDDAMLRLKAEAGLLRALGLTALTVFGSVASGRGHPASDIDFVIETASPDFSYDALIAVSECLEDIFLRDVDVIHARSLSGQLAREVRETGVRITL